LGAPVRETLGEVLSLAGEAVGGAVGEPPCAERVDPREADGAGEPVASGVAVSLGNPLAVTWALVVRDAEGEPEEESEGPFPVGLSEQDGDGDAVAAPVRVPVGDAVQLSRGESLAVAEPWGDKVAEAVAQGVAEGEKSAEADRRDDSVLKELRLAAVEPAPERDAARVREPAALPVAVSRGDEEGGALPVPAAAWLPESALLRESVAKGV
jgi:hypothetical protein